MWLVVYRGPTADEGRWPILAKARIAALPRGRKFATFPRRIASNLKLVCGRGRDSNRR